MRPYNKLAIDYIEAYSKKRIDQANDTILRVCQLSNISENELAQVLEKIKTKASIAIHFHPYRLNRNFQNVLSLLIETGLYKSQFETQISNGSLTAFEGGARDQWENVLFDHVFSTHKISIADRPKYGSLNLLGHAEGPSPRFGSCYFLLKPTCSNYATFTYLDSYLNPKEKGTITFFHEIISSLLQECFERDYALGEKNIRPPQLLKKINDYLALTNISFDHQQPSRNLDHYIEAQIHTPISLTQDVVSLVADASFKNTEYEKRLRHLCEKYAIALKWNRGFELTVEEVPNDFRGNSMPRVAAAIGTDNKINAYVIGQAEKYYQKEIKDQTELQAKLQELKYLWHTLVKYGKPILAY
ncbi:MAG: DUF3626 domain-containing protein [Saprospiraceae bacterium]